MNNRTETMNFRSWHAGKNALLGAALGGGLGYAAHELAGADEKYIKMGAIAGGLAGAAKSAYDVATMHKPGIREMDTEKKISNHPVRYTLNNATKGAVFGAGAGFLYGHSLHSHYAPLYGAAGGLAAGTLYSMYRIATQKNPRA